MQLKYFSLLPFIAAQNTCNDPGNDPNSIRTDLGDDAVLYICNQGFITASGNPQIIVNCNDGVWSPNPPASGNMVCQADSNQSQDLQFRNMDTPDEVKDDCTNPGEIDNAYQYKEDGYNFEHGGTIFYTCQADFCAQHLRTRTVEMTCDNGVWSNKVPKCVPCDPCELPSQALLEQKKVRMTLNGDWTAHLVCDDDYVIKPGTSITDGTVECIENQKWSPEIPTCSRRPHIVCGPDSITVDINKNMLDSLGFTGGSNSLAMVGMNAQTQIIMKDCKPKLDDAGESYQFTIQSPYAGKCMTHFEHDRKTLDNGEKANTYIFKNKIVWRQDVGAVSRRSTVLDFACEYDGIVHTGLDKPIKLALSTRTYIDKRKGYGQQQFTVSMGIYANKDYTNLLESSQVIHAGKRYFVGLYLHEQELGTPYLDSCYGSPNELSQTELLQAGRLQETDNNIKNLIHEGCPVAQTLVRLELPGSTADRRFSFMYPYINLDYDANYMYIHCDIKLRPTGYKPSCARPAAAAAGSGLGGHSNGNQLGENQFFQRSYGIHNDAYDPNLNKENLQRFLKEQGRFSDMKPYLLDNPNENKVHPATIQELEDLKAQEDLMLLWGQKSSLGGTGNNNGAASDNYEVFTGRKRRSVSESDSDFAISIGPMVIVNDKNTKPEDHRELAIKTAVPLKAMPDGSVVVDDSVTPLEEGSKEGYIFKFNTTYKSREEDLKLFKELLPAHRYVEPIEAHEGSFVWDSEKQTSDDKFALDDELSNEKSLETDILAEDILEEINEEEQEEAQNFATRAILIIAGFLVGGGALFAITLFITMKTSLCVDPVSKKNAAVNQTMPDKVRVEKGSCGTSVTSASS